jgi:asparagine synthetase B (glutamine-hydrolysing)
MTYTIRASTPNGCGEIIKSMGIKMVLSGEGADELLEGICISTKHQTQENFTKKMFVN